MGIITAHPATFEVKRRAYLPTDIFNGKSRPQGSTQTPCPQENLSIASVATLFSRAWSRRLPMVLGKRWVRALKNTQPFRCKRYPSDLATVENLGEPPTTNLPIRRQRCLPTCYWQWKHDRTRKCHRPSKDQWGKGLLGCVPLNQSSTNQEAQANEMISTETPA